MMLRKKENNILLNKGVKLNRNKFFHINYFKIFTLLFLVSCFNCAGAVVEKGGHVRNVHLTPQATIVRSSNYKILESSNGESSTLFLFGLFPVTERLDIEYAMSQAVQKIPGGQSLIDVEFWHETHAFFPLGTVSVLKVEGMVISFETEQKEGSIQP